MWPGLILIRVVSIVLVVKTNLLVFISTETKHCKEKDQGLLYLKETAVLRVDTMFFFSVATSCCLCAEEMKYCEANVLILLIVYLIMMKFDLVGNNTIVTTSLALIFFLFIYLFFQPLLLNHYMYFEYVCHLCRNIFFHLTVGKPM